jgi:ABC-type transport system involved in multi-copper enzyme maturation permease subunit
VAGLENATQFLGMVAVVLGGWAIASEYSLGTLRNLLVRQPRRLALLSGSTLAVLSLAALAALAAVAVAVATAFAVAPRQSVDTAAWSAAEVATAAVNTTVAMAGFAALGAALGVVVRSTVAAIGLGVVYVGPGEALVGGAIDAARPWLPAALLGAVADGGTAEIAYGHAVVVLSVYGIVATMLCALLFRRRDVAV